MKNHLIRFMIIVSVFLPPFFIYLAESSYKNYTENLVARQNAINIKQTFQRLHTAKFTEVNLYKTLNSIRRRIKNSDLKENKVSVRRNLHEEIKSELEKSSFKLQIPIQGCILSLVENKIVVSRFGKEMGLSAILNGFDSPAFFSEKRSSASPSGIQNFKFPQDIFLRQFALLKTFNFITHLSIRSHDRIRSLYAHLYESSFIIFCLVDYPDLNHLKQLNHLLKINSNEIQFGAVHKKSGNLIFPGHKKISAELKDRLTRLLKNHLNLSEEFSLGQFKVTIMKDEIRSNYRFFAVTPANTTGKLNYPFIALTAMFSCCLFIMLIERLFFNRGINLSLRTLIPVIFLFIVVQPVFASLFYLETYFSTRFDAYAEGSAKRLNQEVKELDTLTFDRFKKTIDIARSYNSFEKISSFIGFPDCNDLGTLCRELILKLEKTQKGKFFRSIWITAEDDFRAYEWDVDVIREQTQTDSPIANFFKFRFQEIVNYQLSGKKPDRQINELDKNALKADFARTFLISLLGQESFFEFRKYSEFLIEMQSNLKKDYIFCIPFTKNKKPYGFIAWHIQSEQIRQNFPFEKLSDKADNARIVLLNNESHFFSAPLDWNKTQEKFPQLAMLADETNSSRSRGTRIIESENEFDIMDAMMANNSNLTIAGNKTIAGIKLHRAQESAKVYSRLIFSIIFGILVALMAAAYFVAPVEKLTTATREIEKGNFKFRLEDDHPDDFSSIAKSFNLMAQRLEEGKILAGFVSDSVKKEVLQTELDELAQKAETITATVVFSAIENFKQILREKSPAEIIELLQIHLESAVQATRKFGGEIDKMIEDKVMIVFEHKHDKQSFAAEAVMTADLIDRIFFQKTGLNSCSGINTGLTVAGIMGAAQARLSRTVIGDPVNLAARLAAEAEKAGLKIVVSQALANALDHNFVTEELPISSVKGKTQSIKAFHASLKGEN
ncbi:MAG: adenylate/guanylate cyclase domain-containing protein [Candidatus Rifleibacteriota bacterium]